MSFGFKSQKSVTQAIFYVYRKLGKSRINRFNFFISKKIKFKNFKTKEKNINQRSIHDYLIYLEKKFNFKTLKCRSPYYYLSVDVVKCSDKNLHSGIYEKIPLPDKYMYFIKC